MTTPSPLTFDGGEMIPVPTVAATLPARPKNGPDEVADRGHEQGDTWRQCAGGHAGGDRIGRVVETVGVVETHRHDDHDDGGRQSAHKIDRLGSGDSATNDGLRIADMQRRVGAGGRTQDSLTAIVSTVFATCSKASHAASSSSATSFILSTVSASYSPENRRTRSIR